MNFHALMNFKYTIMCLLTSSDTSLDADSREILEFVYKELEWFGELAGRMPRGSTCYLKFREAVFKLDEVIKEQISSSTESRGVGIQSSTDLLDLYEAVHSFSKTLEEMAEEMEDYAEELYPLPEEDDDDEDDDDGAVSSRNVSGGYKSNMVGLSDLYNEVKRIKESTRFGVISLVGMPGIGKTTLAKKIFEDPDIVKHFDCRVWVTIGRKCQLKEIPRLILSQVNPDRDQMLAKEDEDVARCLKESLEGKRYLIVLDDVWDRCTACHLERSIRQALKYSFPNEENGCKILLTTRREQLISLSLPQGNIKMRLLNKEESWDLLREKVFAEELCPPQLEKDGKKIAENCEGLPLTIVKVAHLLSKKERTPDPQYWSEVAEQKNHPLFMVAYDEISKVLLPSYKYLPRILQIRFLHMGVFPQNYEIPRSKLINLWKADGFPELNVNEFIRPNEMECLKELDFNSLVMIYQSTIEGNKMKNIGLHSSLWHLAKREAGKIKFFHILNSLKDGLKEAVENQSRLSFHNNILFGIKNVYKSVEDNCPSTACSLLCYGPYHQYQVLIRFGLRLLRVLDALSIRFYEFPIKVLQLVELRYLALTLNGQLPAFISQLSNLQFLIIDRHMSIKFCGAPSYLPVEIWNMKELQHLEVMGSDFQDPPCGASLESLLTLLNVSAQSCTKVILEAIPNLRKLGIRIELAPDDDGKSLNYLNNIFHLDNLRALKCVIVNPKVIPTPTPLSFFPFHLEKLSLSGFGYSWGEMSKIASLPDLKVLKLQKFAFRGPEWEVEENGFPSLSYLVIEDTDLVEWRIRRGSFKCFLCLRLKHCYKFEKIHSEDEMFIDMIEVIDCNPLGTEEIKKVILTGNKVDFHSSWDDEQLKTRVATQSLKR